MQTGMVQTRLQEAGEMQKACERTRERQQPTDAVAADMAALNAALEMALNELEGLSAGWSN